MNQWETIPPICPTPFADLNAETFLKEKARPAMKKNYSQRPLTLDINY
jgi:hypothetical protein